MRFKLDENVHPDASVVLRKAGHDVETVWDERLQGIADSRLAGVLKRERRVLVTFDVGFADIRAYPPATSPGSSYSGCNDRTDVLSSACALACSTH